jgi:glycosyltransferase involved in cell wall biosynthesis
MPKRVFFDATHTLLSGKNSGIERLVRSLLNEFESISIESRSEPSSVATKQVVFTYLGQFYPVDQRTFDELRKVAAWREDVVGCLPKFYTKVARLACKLFPSSTVKKLLLPSSGHLGIFKLLQNYREARCLAKIQKTTEPIIPTRDDLFLCPDAYWPKNTFWEAAAHARQAGATFSIVLFDLIPVSHTELVGEKQRLAFEEYLIHLASTANLVLAISKTVRDQFCDYLVSKGIDRETWPTISWFPLGGNLPPKQSSVDSNDKALNSSAGSPKDVREQISQLFSRARLATPYLMVASFEPRKNHRFLLDVFDEIWRTNPDLPLCLVGRIGWQCNELLKRIQSHPMLNRSLFVFHDLSDKELVHCYENARGVILPSLVEGFGLPVVESLGSNRRLFVSDIPIHREVGSSDCVYFSLDSTADLISEIGAWESKISSGASIDHPNTQSQIVSWKQSFNVFFETSLEVFRAKHIDTHASITR